MENGDSGEGWIALERGICQGNCYFGVCAFCEEELTDCYRILDPLEPLVIYLACGVCALERCGEGVLSRVRVFRRLFHGDPLGDDSWKRETTASTAARYFGEREDGPGDTGEGLDEDMVGEVPHFSENSPFLEYDLTKLSGKGWSVSSRGNLYTKWKKFHVVIFPSAGKFGLVIDGKFGKWRYTSPLEASQRAIKAIELMIASGKRPDAVPGLEQAIQSEMLSIVEESIR